MTPAALERLKTGARSILGSELPEKAARQFGNYLELLTKWQKRYRLIGSTEPTWVIENLFLDSLLFLKALPADVRSVVDIGSGAGFPGCPLKIARPEFRLTLIESRQGRASFLRTVARELELEGVTILNERLEATVAQEPRFDAAVMRCAGNVERMIPTAARLVRASGVVVVAGPPRSGKLKMGKWFVVEGDGTRSQRRFAVYRAP